MTRSELALQITARALVGVVMAVAAFALTDSVGWALVALLLSGIAINMVVHPK